jgi:phosphoserine aminotransferase
MISFYPGPSRVYDDVPAYVKAAHKKGILSLNHRSEEFMDLSRKTVKLLKQKLDIPADYSVFFACSATECWEMIAQSLIEKESIHLHTGSFGEKWFDYTKRLRPAAQSHPRDKEKLINPAECLFNSGELICITHNETQVDNSIIGEIKKINPDHLLAIDATSSMAGVQLDFKAADIWFASVQKCFGLPAGLAIMICSPRAVERIQAIDEAAHYNSLSLVKQMMSKWQTTCTPNVLGIYLLKSVLKERESISKIDKRTRENFNDWIDFFSSSKKLKNFITNPQVRSLTVIPVTAAKDQLTAIKSRAKKNGFLLGEGYGKLNESTIRIANFPAIRQKEIKSLRKFLRSYL